MSLSHTYSRHQALQSFAAKVWVRDADSDKITRLDRVVSGAILRTARQIEATELLFTSPGVLGGYRDVRLTPAGEQLLAEWTTTHGQVTFR